MGYKNGSIFYYDLDLEEPEGVPLAPPSSIVGGVFEALDGFKVCVDQGASRLEFKLLVHGVGEGTNYNHDFRSAHA